MIAEVKKWGNSLAVRLSRRELEEHGLREGDVVKISIEKVKPTGEVDLSGVPTFAETDDRVSENHDKYLYGGS